MAKRRKAKVSSRKVSVRKVRVVRKPTCSRVGGGSFKGQKFECCGKVVKGAPHLYCHKVSGTRVISGPARAKRTQVYEQEPLGGLKRRRRSRQ